MIVLATPAIAATPPLIVKHSQSGFTPPEYRREETCEVYANRVVIVREYGSGDGSFEQREVRAISLSRGVNAALRKALAEPLEETGGNVCDGPTVQITIGPLAGERFLLSTGGCGQPDVERQGAFSDALRKVVESYCPSRTTPEP
jgi:hypothetical protein